MEAGYSKPYKARVLLVYPPSRSQSHSSCPAGLLMLSAVLDQSGYEVRILDASAANCRRSIDQIAEVVAETKPDVVGVTLVTPLVRQGYELAGRLASTGVRLLAGGPHTTLLPEEPLAHGFLAAVVGEGEPTVVEAVEAVLGRIPPSQVKGLVWRDAGGLVHRNEHRPAVANLDDLPDPARHLVNPADYGISSNGNTHGNIFSSRGCPARCAYCAGGLFGKRFRFRTAKHVLDEISRVHEQFHTTHFHFMDDTMAQDRERASAICEGIVERKLPITWSMMTRIDSVDEALLGMAARSRCVRIDYGVESGHVETLRRIHKPHTVAMVRRAIALTAEAGIEPCVFFIFGFPWESADDTRVTLDLMKELAPSLRQFHPALASILIPFPGTEIYERYRQEYGLDGWWLDDRRACGPPDPRTHSYFECSVFPLAAVLDADFFRYSASVKKEIHNAFEFMHMYNLHQAPALVRFSHRLRLRLSRRLAAVSPSLERHVFGLLRSAAQALGR